MELNYVWWQYFLIPWIAGAVGYFTNVLALFLTFYPLEFWGIPLLRVPGQPWGFFGWQGIIPSKARKMASLSFDLFTEKLFSISELFSRLDADEFSKVMEDSLLLLMDKVISEAAMEYMPSVWTQLPQAVKDDIIVTADTENKAFLAGFMKDMQAHVDDVVDIKTVAVDECAMNKEKIVKVFMECGDQEFVFIKQSGFYFGFLFGVLQMCVWFFYNEDWVLPVFGFLVGWVTNFLALKVIFSPLNPIPMFGGRFVLQGIFLKRQVEVSEIFSRVVMTEILTIDKIWKSIFTGPLSHNFFAMLRAHTLVFVDKLIHEIQPLAIAALGGAEFARMKESIAKNVMDSLPLIIDHSFEYTQRALDMEETVKNRMQELPPAEFEGVLHPAFQEDEIQLVALGGVLGALVGVLQLYTLF